MAITKIGTPELFDFSSLNTALQLPTGTTAERPGTLAGTSAPVAGEWRFNTTLKYVEYYDGAAWFQIDTEALANPDDFPSQNFNTSTYFGNGGTQEVDAKFNEAANFNGGSSSIQAADGISSQGTDLTFSLWFKTTNNSATQMLVDFNYSAGNGIQIYTGSVSTPGQLIFRVATGAATYFQIISAGVISSNTWHNVVGTWQNQASGVAKLYLDGNEINTATSTQTGVLTLGSGNQYLGSRNTGASALNGSLDQVRIFNTALTDAQAEDLYTDETATTAATLNYPVGAGCIAAYQLDGDASDISGTYGGVTTDIGYTGLKFQPDLVWAKRRSDVEDNALFDSVRGVQEQITSNKTNTQSTKTNALSSFDSNGFTTGDNNALNTSGQTYVSWNWYAPTSETNTDGSITSTIKKNVDAGFSIVKYTAGGAANVGHGLSAAPELIINKIMLLAPSNWPVYVSSSVVSAAGFGKYISLDDSSNIVSSSGVFSNVDATTFTSNWSGTTFEFINYCFISIPNYQKIGSYVGDNAPGNIISTELTVGDGGFEPALVMIKLTSATSGNWIVFDNKRNSVNPRTDVLKWDTDGAETTEAALDVTFATNGFVLNGAAGAPGTGQINSSGETYLYLAIAADKDTSVPTLANSFETVLYTGNGGTQNISTSFAPDLTWIKGRTGPTESHVWNDTIRGISNAIYSNTTGGQYFGSGFYNTSFNPNGFTVSDNTAGNYGVNGNPGTGIDYVAWCWKAGGLPTINNVTGSTITSIVSANQASGFSVVKYKGNGVAGATIGHGLSSAPQLILQKRTETSANWFVYSSGIGNTKYLVLDSDIGASSAVDVWNSTDPTDKVFSVSSFGDVNGSGISSIAYCFHSVAGYQKVGSYNGGSSGSLNVISTSVGGDAGFKPSFLIVKRTDQTGDAWQIFDSTMAGADTFDSYLQANTNAAEASYNLREVNFTNTGFYWTYAESGTNISGGTYIYLAIA